MDGLTDAVSTELIAINYAKRKLGRLPDEWYDLDLEFSTQGKWDSFPSDTQVDEAMRILK